MSQAGYTPIQLYYSTTAAATPSAGNLANGELAVNITDGKLFYKDNGGVVRVLATAAGSAGDVVGPGSSTDNALVRFDGTTGKLVQSSVGILSDAGALSGLASVAATTFTGALTGNASTATTLQTSRTIWGQSFDGSANVTGALTGVTDLTASGSLTLNGGTANGVAYLNGSKVLTTGSALTFDGTNLGVGTASPLVSAAGRGNVTINGSTDSILSFGSAGVNTGYLYATTSGLELASIGNTYVRFSTNGSEQMRLTSTGLGIGTSSPQAKVHAAGAILSSGGLVALSASNIFVDQPTSALSRIGVVGANTSTYGKLSISQYSSDGSLGRDALTLDSSGNVGIGSNAVPSVGSTVVLGVGGANGGTLAVLQSGNIVYRTSASTSGVDFYNPNSSPMQWYTAGASQMLLDASGNFKFNSGYGSAATAYACRAWVNFNGTGTVAIRASGNVSSITDIGVGLYQVNFSTAMTDLNYAVAASGANSTGTSVVRVPAPGSSLATTSFQVDATDAIQAARIDINNMFCAVFR